MWLWFRIWTKILADRRIWRKKDTDRRICIPLFTPLQWGILDFLRFIQFESNRNEISVQSTSDVPECCDLVDMEQYVLVLRQRDPEKSQILIIESTKNLPSDSWGRFGA